MSRKFIIQKDVEYKNGVVDTWYMIKLEQEDGSTQFIDCCKGDEDKALELFDVAVEKWVPSTKSIIKEVIVD